MFITAISINPKRPDRAVLKLTDREDVTLPVNTLLELGLHVGDEIDADAFSRLNELSTVFQAINQALLLIAFRQRPERDTLERFRTQCHSQQTKRKEVT